MFAGSFAHDEKGLRSLCRTLVRMNVTLVAIERPDGLLVERLRRDPSGPSALHPGCRRAYARSSLSIGASWASSCDHH